MNNVRLDCFIKKIHTKTSPGRIYSCRGTRQGLTSRFLSNATYTTHDGSERGLEDRVQKGDAYCRRWHNWDDREEGAVLETDGRNFNKFSFGAISNVSVRLADQGDSVLVTLLQDEIPTDKDTMDNAFYGCSNGWTFWPTNLKAYLEHGIVLNEKTVNLRNDPFAGFEYVI